MKKLSLTFNATSQDSSVEFTTLAEYNNNRIKFVDEDGVLNYVVIKKDIIEYYKKGDIDMKYKFDLDHVTKGYYRVMGNEFNFEIVTNTLQVDDSSILVEYDLYQNSDLVNKTKISLLYETKEES
jgi:uncharacterized beta-barrel protein YwiB (DUF1934 family)